MQAICPGEVTGNQLGVHNIFPHTVFSFLYKSPIATTFPWAVVIDRFACNTVHGCAGCRSKTSQQSSRSWRSATWALTPWMRRTWATRSAGRCTRSTEHGCPASTLVAAATTWVRCCCYIFRQKNRQSEIHNPRGWKSRLFQPLFFSQVLGDWLCITLPYCVFRALLSLVS